MRRSPRPPSCSNTSNLPPAGHLGVLSLPKGLCYPLPQVSAQVPAPFGLVHWPFLTELKETTVAESGHLGPRLPRPWGGGVGGACGACAVRRAGSPPPPPADLRSFTVGSLPSRQGRCSPVSASLEIFSPGIRPAPRGKADSVYPGDSFAFQ